MTIDKDEPMRWWKKRKVEPELHGPAELPIFFERAFVAPVHGQVDEGTRGLWIYVPPGEGFLTAKRSKGGSYIIRWARFPS